MNVEISRVILLIVIIIIIIIIIIIKCRHKIQPPLSLSNDVVKWLAILLRIRDVPGSHLGPETGYPD
jgi:hypothetical protein